MTCTAHISSNWRNNRRRREEKDTKGAPVNESSLLQKKKKKYVRQWAVNKHAVLGITAVTDLPIFLFLSCGASARLRAMYSPFKVSRSHLDTPYSAERLCTSNQPDAETYTWQKTTLTRNRNPCPRWVRTHNPSKRAAGDPRLRVRGHWNRQLLIIIHK